MGHGCKALTEPEPQGQEELPTRIKLYNEGVSHSCTAQGGEKAGRQPGPAVPHVQAHTHFSLFSLCLSRKEGTKSTASSQTDHKISVL